MLVQGSRKGNIDLLFVEVKTGTATLETSMDV